MSKSSPWRNPMIQVWCGLLLIFFVANGIFIYLAQTTSPGLVVDDYYERGQDYEKHMLTRLAQNPGWQMQLELVDAPVLDRSGLIRFHLTHQNSELLVPDSVVLYAYRPSNAEGDFSAPLLELHNGLYEARVAFPLPGVWDLLIVVFKDGSEFSEALRINVAKAS